VIEVARRKRGGLFSRVDAMLASLKSAASRLPRKRKIDPCVFLTDAAIEEAYERYRSGRFGAGP
jgi:hypothetical protein